MMEATKGLEELIQEREENIGEIKKMPFKICHENAKENRSP